MEPLKSARAIQPDINRLPRNKNEGHEKDKTKGSKRTKRRAQKEKTKDNNRTTARQHIRLSIHDFLQNMDVHYSTSSLRHMNPNGNNQSCNEPKKNNSPTPTKEEAWRSYKIGQK